MYLIRLPFRSINSAWAHSISWGINTDDFFKYLNKNRTHVHSLRILALVEHFVYFKTALGKFRGEDLYNYLVILVKRFELNLNVPYLENVPKEFKFIINKLKEIMTFEAYCEGVNGPLRLIYENINLIDEKNILINEPKQSKL